MERFWKTEEWKNYLLNSKIGVDIKDHSFYLNGKFVPLIQEGQEFFSPGFDDDKNILKHVKELAQQHSIKRIQVNSRIKSYLNISGYTCTINPFNININKGHKSAIKKAEQYLEFQIETKTEQFMLDYFKIANKKTRPSLTFEILKKWIELGYGTLLKATYQGNTAGYMYIIHYDSWITKCAYYFMSCTFEDYKKYNVSHYLQSIVFKMLKEKNIHYYELGEQVFNSLTCNPTEKERNISLFKRGFGGDIVIKPISEYFFDERYYRETMLNRINKYWEHEHEHEQNNTILSKT